MMHEILQVAETNHKRMEVPGGWVYLMYDFKYVRSGGLAQAGGSTYDGGFDWEYVLISSVFVPNIIRSMAIL